MESRAKLLGHPVHQMLVPIPAGLFIVGAVLDIVHAFTGTDWIPTVSFWNLVIGVVAALVAAVFGLVDYSKIPRDTRAKQVAMTHGIGNVIAVALFVIALIIRRDLPYNAANGTALTLEIIAFLMLGVTAWLGGELVDRLGVGVDDGAHLDAPNSLRTRSIATMTRHH